MKNFFMHLFTNALMTATISAAQIVFDASNSIQQVGMQPETAAQFGSVGCISEDREMPELPFVLISVDAWIMTVIRPRIRINEDGTIELGQDRASAEEQEAFANAYCRCQDCITYPEMMPAGWAECARKKFAAYSATFVPAEPGTQYKTETIEIPSADSELYIWWRAKPAEAGEILRE